MVALDCWKTDPALLPPSPRAAFFHGVRVHHQIVVWKDLSDVNKEPLRWGWKIQNSSYTLIMTDIKTEPPQLLRIVRLGGKSSCGAKYGCRKAPAIRSVISVYWSRLRSSYYVGVLKKQF